MVVGRCLGFLFGSMYHEVLSVCACLIDHPPPILSPISLRLLGDQLGHTSLFGNTPSHRNSSNSHGQRGFRNCVYRCGFEHALLWKEFERRKRYMPVSLAHDSFTPSYPNDQFRHFEFRSFVSTRDAEHGILNHQTCVDDNLLGSLPKHLFAVTFYSWEAFDQLRPAETASSDPLRRPQFRGNARKIPGNARTPQRWFVLAID
ncbi:uncharacterized protein BT62DRAFT_1013734 [Guyanagaster necrorhizus]|uniref:Uncharacterized protein n=1 Tax=Guyanagaster necrorhizus TaxID=856835 RepID=A0A9P7VG95_9AGAR|nr:uncharacterized protein BT62DRAFT_1013734 [Guyanagaster necrorhizus MCA 3950]KAG7439586.1 hypothetical protein BT62DRAFT_1013734 [Guyanagaster necrorhizus MCA 3950]